MSGFLSAPAMPGKSAINEMTIAPKRNISEENSNATTEIKTESLQQKRMFKGELIPVLDYNLFEDAFRFAANNYGENQRFWWGENVYSTNKK